MMGHNSNDAYGITASELRQFKERIEQLEAEKKDIMEQIKEVYSEMKGRGFDTKVFKVVVKEMAKNPDEVAEFEAVKDMYKEALLGAALDI